MEALRSDLNSKQKYMNVIFKLLRLYQSLKKIFSRHYRNRGDMGREIETQALESLHACFFYFIFLFFLLVFHVELPKIERV